MSSSGPSWFSGADDASDACLHTLACPVAHLCRMVSHDSSISGSCNPKSCAHLAGANLLCCSCPRCSLPIKWFSSFSMSCCMGFAPSIQAGTPTEPSALQCQDLMVRNSMTGETAQHSVGRCSLHGRNV